MGKGNITFRAVNHSLKKASAFLEHNKVFMKGSCVFLSLANVFMSYTNMFETNVRISNGIQGLGFVLLVADLL